MSVTDIVLSREWSLGLQNLHEKLCQIFYMAQEIRLNLEHPDATYEFTTPSLGALFNPVTMQSIDYLQPKPPETVCICLQTGIRLQWKPDHTQDELIRHAGILFLP